jgi:hypothetical protein
MEDNAISNLEKLCFFVGIKIYKHGTNVIQ